MVQKCYASISSTGLQCAWCENCEVMQDGVWLDQAFCEKHKMPCEDLNYYCGDFIGYRPDYRMTDDEEQQIINELRNK